MPSGEIAFVFSGSVTRLTSGASAIAATIFATACWFAGSPNVCPAGAASATRAVPPPTPASGNVALRWSIARCDSVPGIETALLSWPDRPTAPAPEDDQQHRPHTGDEPPAAEGRTAEAVEECRHRMSPS